MKVAYYVRYFNALGEQLGFQVIACSDDASALQTATYEPIPEGCMSVEVTRENRFVWRGNAVELGATVH